MKVTVREAESKWKPPTPDEVITDWCEAARGVEDGYGIEKAMGYLIGEKFLTCMTSDIPETLDFAHEIQRVFTAEQMEPYFKKLMRIRQPQELARRRRARRLLLGK